MTIEDIQQKIELLARKICKASGVDLIELKVVGHINDIRIQITADKLPGGITIGQCAILNKALVAAIRQEDLLTPGTFSLEVSSPGIDKPRQGDS
jgi:ribosome maturation factor RimP